MLAHEQTLPKAMRLKTPQEFRDTFASGKRIRSRPFTLIARNNDLEHPRLGLAVSKRCAARAVDRNRIKRVVRESFRRFAVELPTMDIIIQATAAAREESNAELAASLLQLWEKLSNGRESSRQPARENEH